VITGKSNASTRKSTRSREPYKHCKREPSPPGD
jgi:hypothetical protein